MPGLNSGLSPNIVQTALDNVLYQEFDAEQAPNYGAATDEALFRQRTTDRAADISEQHQGVGYFDTRTELQDVPGGTSRTGNQRTSSVVNYAKSVDISKNLFDDDLHNTVTETISDMGRKARLTRDRNAMTIYNNGFSTQTTNDGSSLFNNSHTGLSGNTVDNLETGTLSGSNLEISVNSLLQQRTQDNTLGGHQPATLFVPTALLKEAMEVTKSVLRAGTANNDLNYFSHVWPGLQIRWSPFLSATEAGSDTAWFLLGKAHSIRRIVRQPLQTNLVDWRFQRNNNYIYKAEYREVVDSISYEGVVGSDGSI